jgi:hypothetical protein
MITILGTPVTPYFWVKCGNSVISTISHRTISDFMAKMAVSGNGLSEGMPVTGAAISGESDPSPQVND